MVNVRKELCPRMNVCMYKIFLIIFFCIKFLKLSFFVILKIVCETDMLRRIIRYQQKRYYQGVMEWFIKN